MSQHSIFPIFRAFALGNPEQGVVACLLVAAALHGLRQVMLQLIRRGWTVDWQTTSTVTTRSPDGQQLQWQLACDLDVSLVEPFDATLTWSGLLWLRGGLGMPQKLRAHLIATYLTATDRWLQADPSWRWETLTQALD